MELKLVKPTDVTEISTIWHKHHREGYSLPDRQDLITEAKAVQDGKIVAYGQVRHVAEPIFVVDLDARPRDRMRALEMLMEEAYRGVHKAELRRMFCFIRDPRFANLISKHFGFEPADLGHFLIREL